MTPAKTARSTRHTVSRPVPERIRTFRLTVLPSGSAYGIGVDETYGHDTLTNHVITASAAQTQRVVDAVIASVKASGHPASVLALTRERGIPLDEAAGVRLALVLFASQPVTKNERIRAIVAGINTMSVEETYYWYAKCIGPEASRARKALRILLADDRTGGMS